MTAVDMLTRFSGANAEASASWFRYSEDARITGIEIHAVGIEATTARYSGRDADVYKEVNNILRITTADGFEGISGVDSYSLGAYSDAHLRELERVVADLPEMETLDPIEVGMLLAKDWPDISDGVRSSIDIVLWDLAARKAGLPLYEFLGKKRDSIEPYASLPFYESLPEYIDAVNDYAKLGYSTFKFHVWGEIDKDMQLVERVQQAFGDSAYRFMIDLENAYGLEDALKLGRAMDRGLFNMFEAPIDDTRLEDYSALRQQLTVAVIPAGYTHYSTDFVTRGVHAEAWDAGRFDVTTVGGISPSLELLSIANDAGLPVEIQSWGHSLTQVANLHLMLANERTRYFEAPMPKDAFEFGMKNGNLLAANRVLPPAKPGLGIDVDWETLSAADFYVYVRLGD